MMAGVMVDTGSEYTWLPEELPARAGVGVRKRDLAFVMANGARITRDVGYAYLRNGGFETVDEVVFARPGDLRLLGARMIEGFAALVDARRNDRATRHIPKTVTALRPLATPAARSGRAHVGGPDSRSNEWYPRAARSRMR